MIQIMLHISNVPVYISLDIPCSFAYKVVSVDDKLSKPVVFYRRKNAVNTFIEEIIK